MVNVGDKVWFTKGELGKKRNSWKVRAVGPGKSRRFVVVTKPLNGQGEGGRVMFLVIDTLLQRRDKDYTIISKIADKDEKWEAIIAEYASGERIMTGKTSVKIADIIGLND